MLQSLQVSSGKRITPCVEKPASTVRTWKQSEG